MCNIVAQAASTPPSRAKLVDKEFVLVRGEIALVRGEIRESASGLRSEWERSLRVFFFAQLGAGIALASLVVAAIKLI